jgi:hypothetical protein
MKEDLWLSTKTLAINTSHLTCARYNQQKILSQLFSYCTSMLNLTAFWLKIIVGSVVAFSSDIFGSIFGWKSLAEDDSSLDQEAFLQLHQRLAVQIYLTDRSNLYRSATKISKRCIDVLYVIHTLLTNQQPIVKCFEVTQTSWPECFHRAVSFMTGHRLSWEGDCNFQQPS